MYVRVYVLMKSSSAFKCLIAVHFSSHEITNLINSCPYPLSLPPTDLATRCQSVQCPTSCPPDSYLQSPLDLGYADEYDESDSNEREKRAIAMNTNAHGPIKIIPSALQFPYANSVQRLHRHLAKRDTIESPSAAQTDYAELQQLCCPRCTCLPCPEQPVCPPDTKPLIVDQQELQHGQPGNCCPAVHCQPEPVMCFSSTHRTSYPTNATWQEDACTVCRCEAGEPKCQTSLCKPLNCEHKLELPNVCCPVCDPAKSIFCEEHNCAIWCKYGYERRTDGCALCKCLTSPLPAAPIEVIVASTTARTSQDEPSLTVDGHAGDALQDGKQETADRKDGWFNDLRIVLLLAGAVLLLLVIVTLLYRQVTIESVKKWLKLLFRCNQLPQRKTAYNRVSSTAPPIAPTPAPTGVQANDSSMA